MLPTRRCDYCKEEVLYLLTHCGNLLCEECYYGEEDYEDEIE